MTAWMRVHPAWTVFLGALFVRLVCLVLVRALAPQGWLALDDRTYVDLAGDMAAGTTGEWSDYLHQLYGATATFLIPLTLLFWLLGPSQLLGSVMVAVVGAGAAGMTTAVARRALDPAWAVTAGGVVAVLPSQVGWSVTTLKDPWVWLAAAAIAYAVARTLGSESTLPVWPWIGVAVSLFLLSHLRLHSTVVAAWSVVVSVAFGAHRFRWPRVAIALVIAVVIPWVSGAGPAGMDLVAGRVGSLGEMRTAGSEGAASAVVESDHGDDRAESSPTADLAHLPRGLSVMLLEPYPWSATRNSRLAFAKLDTLLWYPILILASIGAVVGVRYRRVVAFPLLYGAGVIVMYALAEGNLGTAFRHRGEAVWAAAILAAFGARHLLKWRRGATV